MCATAYLPGRGLDTSGNYGWLDAIKKQEKGTPTLKTTSNFNVEDDCKRLKKAMDGCGPDKDELIAIMSKRTVTQRVTIVQKYMSMFQEDLIARIECELRGNFEDCLLALCYTPPEYDATQLYKAIEGEKTDEDALIDILCTRSSRQMQNIKELYAKIYPHRTLEEDIKCDICGKFRLLMVALLHATREDGHTVDLDQAKKDATDLFNAGDGKFSTDNCQFINLLASRSELHIKKVIEMYKELSGKDIEASIKAETSGTFRNSLLTIINYVKDKHKYYAEQLHNSMEGLGSNDSTLIRIIVSRCEIDLQDIKEEFEILNGDSLSSWIESDASGRYQKLLLALLGE